MAPEDTLFAIAEISIGLAGFSGLVAAFARREDQCWRPEQKARIVLLIVIPFEVIVCALAPFAIAGISTSPSLVWGIPMIAFSLMALVQLVHWIVVARRQRFTLQFPCISLPVLCVAVGLQVVCFLSGAGWIMPYSPTLFVFGFLAVLVFGAIVFLALLNSIWS